MSTRLIDQPAGPFEFCDATLGAYWQPGRWTRDKLRGRALSDRWASEEYGLEPAEIFRAKFHVGWMVETIQHDGEWCDPQWPVYTFQESLPEDGRNAMEVSWLELPR
jgi:hypothetical protein